MWSIILDVLLLLIAVITVYLSVKRGLVKTVIDACTLILSVVVSFSISPIFKSYFEFPGEHGQVATYFIIFIISWVLVKIAALLLDKIISALPIIRTINKFGGFLLGILMGIFRISLYCIAVGGIIAIGQKLGWEFVNEISIADTVLMKYFYEYNPIYLLVGFILK